jgi:arabinofuranosyltransferase
VLLGCVLVAGCVYAALCCASGDDISGQVQGSDDAYISYRYARNAVAGHGLVFNPGERVEGYSNLLYVLAMTVPFRLGLDVFRFAVTFNVACTVAAFALFVAHRRRAVGDERAVLAALLFAACPSLWIWTGAGLETPLVLFLQVAIWASIDRGETRDDGRGRWALGAATALLILARADGFVTAAIALAYVLARRRLQTAAVLGAVAAVTLVGLVAWRHGTYGELWPNTYYAKVSGTLPERARAALGELRGIVARQGLDACLGAVGFGLGVAALQARRDGLAAAWRALRFDLVFAVGWTAYWVYVGGDVYEERFLLVLVPLGLSVLFRTVLPSADAPLCIFVVALGLVAELAVPVRSERFGRHFARYDRWITLGRLLADRPAEQVLAIDAAGKVPFFSGLRTIDILGLNDRHIARVPSTRFVAGHDKYDPEYVLSRRPDLIASWFEDEDLDLRYGMTRAKYEAAGYRLRYLVNSTPASRGDDVLDARGRPPEEIVSLLRGGYMYAVLERSEP